MNTNDEKTPAAPHSSGYPGGYGPHEDEIDLADLIAVLYRRKWLIICITLMAAAVAICIPVAKKMMTPEKYIASASIRIGERLVENPETGEITTPLIEPLDSAKERINNLARTEFEKLKKNPDQKNNPGDPGFSIKNDFTVTYDKNGSVIELEVKTVRDSKARTFLNNLAEAFIKDQEHLLLSKKKTKNAIQKYTLDIKQSDAVIDSLTGKIGDIGRNWREKIVEKKNVIENLAGSIHLEESKIAIFKQRIEDLKKYQSRVGKHAHGFENSLYLDITGEISRLRIEMEKARLRIQNHKAASALEEKRLEGLKTKMDSEIKTVQNQIRDKQLQKQHIQLDIQTAEEMMEDVNPTQILSSAQVSDKPVNGMNYKLVAVLGLISGLFIGVFAAFVLEFWQNNRDKIVASARGRTGTTD